MLHRLMIEELQARGVMYASRFAPYWIASLGAHILNLRNKTAPFWWLQGEPADLRLHVMFISPPGFSKSLFTRQFIVGRNAFIRNSGIQGEYVQQITAAGLVGTYVYDGSRPSVREGLLKRASNAIIATDEFDNIVKMANQQHSSNIINVLLSALEDGYVRKELGAGEIAYETRSTLWAATQPLRFEMSSGLFRRFIYIVWIPSRAEEEELRRARRAGVGRTGDPGRLTQIRNGLRRKRGEAGLLREVEIDESFYRLLDEFDVPHYEESLYERLAAGWVFMKTTPGKVLKISVDEHPELRQMIKQLSVWRLQARFGPDLAQAAMVIAEGNGHPKMIEKRVYFQRMIRLGVDMRTASRLLGELAKMNVIKFVGDEIRMTGDLT